MQHDNAINALHEAMAAAVHVDLPDVEYDSYDWLNKDAMGKPAVQKRTRRPFGSELTVIMFEQLWDSTATGYGGLGGAAMTYSYTVIVVLKEYECVYYGSGDLAYRVNVLKLTDDQKEEYDRCVDSRTMPSVRDALNMFKGAIEGKVYDI